MRTARCWGGIALIASLLAIALAGVRTAVAHDLHSTVTELTYAPETKAVRVSIRLFADDFDRAVERMRAQGVEGDPVLRYLGASFRLKQRGGDWVPLQWCGARRAGDLYWITLRGTAPNGLQGGAIWNSLLFELFEDQVNIVQVRNGGSRRSMVFTRGDGGKRLQ